jgi:hypothetical protein
VRGSRYSRRMCRQARVRNRPSRHEGAPPSRRPPMSGWRLPRLVVPEQLNLSLVPRFKHKDVH